MSNLQGQTAPARAADRSVTWARAAAWGLLTVAAALFALHFLCLSADFPNNSPWTDWAKYTDEGWYGDAAIRHYTLGHWYVPGDFNPAVALPVWPLLLAAVFRFTGVSLIAARGFTVCLFGAMACLLYVLIQRYSPPRIKGEGRGDLPLAARLAVLFLCASPFFFAFDRLAILEPPLAMLTVLALYVASRAELWNRGARTRARYVTFLWPQIALGLLLPGMVLTKTTAVAVFPAIGYLLWHRAGRRMRSLLQIAVLPIALGGSVWLGYLLLFVRPHYLEDYQYLFSANGYTGFQLEPLATVLFNTVADGTWIGAVLYPAFFAGVAFLLFARPSFFRNPLVGALLLWIAGYFTFLAYHNNLQPRYYLMPAVPLTALVALMLEELRHAPLGARSARGNVLRPILVAAVVSAIVIPDALVQLSFVRHPEYSFEAAAHALAHVVRSDPKQSPLILSISGSDITLMTGLPSIDDDFGTLDLDQRVRQYRPGWYVAWNQIEDDKMDALTPLYHPVRVATFPAMDDPERNQLILYRLDPIATPGPLRKRRLRTPRPLRTRLGQQPTTTQLQH